MEYAFGMQTDSMNMSVCACVRVCAWACVFAAWYTRERLQSWAIEWKEKDGGELMRKWRRIQSFPVDNPTAHFKQMCTYIGYIFAEPFGNYGSTLRLRNYFSRVIFDCVSDTWDFAEEPAWLLCDSWH